MRILLLTLMYEQSKFNYFMRLTDTNIDLPVAANSFQINLIKGLKQNGVNLKALNSLPVGTWPKQFRKCYMPKKRATINGVDSINTQTINIVGLKQISRSISAFRVLDKYCKKNPNAAIITYNFYLPYYMALNRIKKKYPNIHICTLVTDLPNEYGIVSEKGIRKILSREIGVRSMKLTENASSFVLLTEQMKNPLRVAERPYVIVEGFADDTIPYEEETSSGKDDKKIIVYTGTLNVKFGVGNLLDAFLMLKRDDVELHIYGGGEMAERLKNESENNQSIKYFGNLERSEVIKAQRKATILVNPRDNTEEFTKYSFPSKTMEYLMSGRPTAAVMLDGIPANYKKHIIEIKSGRKEDIAEALDTLLNMSENERTEFGRSSRLFALSSKNCKVQCNKIINLINQMDVK